MKHIKLFSAVLGALLGMFFITTAVAQTSRTVLSDEVTIDLVMRPIAGQEGSLALEWYAPAALQNFVVRYQDLASGETQEVVISNQRWLRLEGIDSQKDYKISVVAVDAAKKVMAHSAEERWLGETSRQALAQERLAKPNSSAPVLNATLRSLDSNNFPFIFTTVAIDTSGISVGTLTASNFTAQEDNRLQTDFFQVTPPQQGGGVRILDFIFLIDNSGSMGPEQQQVKDNVSAFVDSLAKRQIDFRLGLVRFGQSLNGGQPIAVNNGVLTGDINVFKSWLNLLTIDGGFEPGIAAVFTGATGFGFRPGSQRHFLLITDEDSDGGDLAQTITTCQNNGITVHAAVDCNFGASQADYCAATSIRGATGGRLFNVIGPYRDILDVLTKDIGNTYIVRYRTDNPLLDGKQREVRITVNAFGQSDFVLGYYTPGAAPKIIRTTATINLSNSAQIAGTALTIAATITDAAAPFVQSATLFYRTTGAASYNVLPMSITSNNIYQAVIPGGAVVSPGIDYYISATDGQVTSTDPTIDPDRVPYQIAVLPNQPPQITHTPVTSGNAGSSILISATVTDNTNALAGVTLYYRVFGTLLFNSVTMSSTGSQYSGTIPAGSVTNAGVEYYIRAVDNFGVATTHGIHFIRTSAPPVSTIKPEVTPTQLIGAEFVVDIVVTSVQNLFGVSFELFYTNTSFIDYVSAENGGFLGTDVVFLPTPNDAAGKVSIGISRKLGQGGVSGNGTVVRVRFKSLATTPPGTVVTFDVRNVAAIDPAGAAISLTPLSATTTITGLIVWPGDTNNDKIVNQADVLPLGLHWSRTGPQRANASLAWTGQVAAPWSPEAATYADANGDGKVDQADVLPIGLNWGRTHAAPSLIIAEDENITTISKTHAAIMRTEITGDTDPGQEVWVEIRVEQATNLFGQAFELLYAPASLVDPQTVIAGDLLGDGVVFYSQTDKNAGKISLGITRKAGQRGVDGAGVVAKIKMRLSSAARHGDAITLTLQNAVANDPDGRAISANATSSQFTIGGVASKQSESLPEIFALHPNTPNPFNPATTIHYDLPEQRDVQVEILDMLGKRVRLLVNESQPAGRYAARWDGRNDAGREVASGVFIYQLRAIPSTPSTSSGRGFVQHRKMLLLR